MEMKNERKKAYAAPRLHPLGAAAELTHGKRFGDIDDYYNLRWSFGA